MKFSWSYFIRSNQNRWPKTAKLVRSVSTLQQISMLKRAVINEYYWKLSVHVSHRNVCLVQPYTSLSFIICTCSLINRPTLTWLLLILTFGCIQDTIIVWFDKEVNWIHAVQYKALVRMVSCLNLLDHLRYVENWRKLCNLYRIGILGFFLCGMRSLD